MDGRPTWTDCDEAGDYIVSDVLSPRDLVSRPDKMDKTVPHTTATRQRIMCLFIRKLVSIAFEIDLNAYGNLIFCCCLQSFVFRETTLTSLWYLHLLNIACSDDISNQLYKLQTKLTVSLKKYLTLP